MVEPFVDVDIQTLGPCRHEIRIYATAPRWEPWRAGDVLRHHAGDYSIWPGRRTGEAAGRRLMIREAWRRQGVATWAYRLIGAHLIGLGEVLTNALPDVQLTDGSRALWGPLVRLGCTVDATDDEGRPYWRLENPDGTEPTP